MGIFNRKTRISVASAAVKLAGDAPDITQHVVIAAVLQDTTDTLASQLVEAHLNGLALKLNNALNYAKSTYTLGLPEGTMQYGKAADAVVIPILQVLEGVPVTLLFNVYDVADAGMMSYQHLQENRGWDADTDVVSAPPFTPPGGAGDVSYEHSAFSTTSEQIVITYSYVDATVTYFETELIAATGVDPSDLYYHVAYVTHTADKSEITSAVKYWVYRVGDNTFPQLNVVPETKESPYYPIVPLRRENVDMTDISLAGTDLYQTSDRLLEIIGLDFVTLGSDVNANPSIADIDHAYVMFAINLHAESDVSIAYLHEYFSYLAGISNVGKSVYDTWAVGGRAEAPLVNTLKIADAGLRIEVTYTYADVVVVGGSIGSVGTVDRITNVVAPHIQTKSVEVYIAVDDNYVFQNHFVYDTELSTVVFRKQLTAGTYSQVTVLGLIHTNYVYGNHTVETTVALSNDPDDQNFNLPLNQFVFSGMSISERNRLIHDAFRIVFNSYVKTKAKWYEASVFRTILVVAAIAITVVTAGQDGGFTMNLALSMGFAVGSTAALLASIVIAYAIGQITAKVFTVIVKELGIDNALLLTVMAVVAVSYGYIDAGSLQGAPFANQLLSAVSALTTGIQGVVQEQAEQLASDYVVFLDDMEEEFDLLAEAQSLLEVTCSMDPNLFLDESAFIFLDETPQEFYTRTIHSGNVGIESLNAIPLYVATELQLPTLADTLIG